jgi:fatty-acid desaturase
VHLSLLKLQKFNHQIIQLTAMIFMFAHAFSYVGVVNIFAGIMIGGFVVSAYYHRCLSHKSWEAPEWLHRILLVNGATFALSPALIWVDIHRKHHRYADTDQDPHGPKAGIKKNLFLSFADTDMKSVRRELRNPLLLWQLKHYWHLLAVGFVFWSFVFGPESWLIITGLIYFAQIVVNVVGHYGGLTQSHILSVLTSGELYHKRHHEDPNEAKFGLIDIPYYLMIRWTK